MGHRICSSTSVVFLWNLCKFIQKINLNLIFWHFKLSHSTQELVLAPGPQLETIRYELNAIEMGKYLERNSSGGSFRQNTTR